MSFLLFLRKTRVCWFLAMATPGLVFSQPNYVTNSSEYAIAGARPGDQVHPRLSLTASGGFLVWEDNLTDGQGLGVRALALDGNLAGVQPSFRVNQIGAGDQERAQVALFGGGGAVFVWQGGRQGFHHIYARFLSSSNIWLAGDVLVNTFSRNAQVNPVVATLGGSNAVVAWASFNQASSNSLQDVYAQVLSATGQKIGGEFQVNQFTSFNQRNPAVAALSDGRFVVTWISEQQRVAPVLMPMAIGPASTTLSLSASVDVYARIFTAGGQPATDEFPVNTALNPCSAPSVAAGSDGGFVVAWAQRDLEVRTNGWDIFARAFSSTGQGGAVQRVNTCLYGDQYAPEVSVIATNYLVVWTSLGQDGSWEGVYGQFLQNDGSASGAEFRVNTTTLSRQMQPAVAADGAGRFLAVWTSYAGLANGFDLYAQQYAGPGFIPPVAEIAYGPPPSDPFLLSLPPWGPGPSGGGGAGGGALAGPPRLDFPIAGAGSGTGNPSNAFALAKGPYNGLFYDTNGVTPASAGYFSATATDRGAYSARVWLGNRNYSIAGRFDSLGRATNTIARPGAASLTVLLQLDLSGGDQIRGRVTDGTFWADLQADRLVFDRVRTPTTYAGNYTLLIPAEPESVNSPAGHGYGTVRVDGGGTLQWSGTLADGTKVSQSSALSKQGIWPLFASPYGGRGSLVSWIQFTNQPDSDLNGQLLWIKPGGLITGSYPAGFTNEVEAAGSLYTRPPVGARALALTQGSLLFSGGGLSGLFTNGFSLDMFNRATSAPGEKLSLSLATASGLFKGTALSPDTGKSLPFQGAVFQKANYGAGFFWNTNQSGQVLLLGPAP